MRKSLSKLKEKVKTPGNPLEIADAALSKLESVSKTGRAKIEFRKKKKERQKGKQLFELAKEIESNPDIHSDEAYRAARTIRILYEDEL